jgi:glycine cleavage system H protein
MSYSVPTDRKYSRSHFWVKIESGEAVIGKTDYGQAQLGTVTAVNINTVGNNLSQGETFGTITTDVTSNLVIPIGGDVNSKNSLLSTSPGLVNISPYNSGWMIKVKNYDGDEYDELLDPAEYDKMTND